mmetsp:Transcript_540/g.2127  ORF Transcript_540/g.2127 Transcript_540/m.2127 type:complete len:348 (+) Transcript_540:1690-2733(+)
MRAGGGAGESPESSSSSMSSSDEPGEASAALSLAAKGGGLRDGRSGGAAPLLLASEGCFRNASPVSEEVWSDSAWPVPAAAESLHPGRPGEAARLTRAALPGPAGGATPWREEGLFATAERPIPSGCRLEAARAGPSATLRPPVRDPPGESWPLLSMPVSTAALTSLPVARAGDLLAASTSALSSALDLARFLMGAGAGAWTRRAEPRTIPPAIGALAPAPGTCLVRAIPGATRGRDAGGGWSPPRPRQHASPDQNPGRRCSARPTTPSRPVVGAASVGSAGMRPRALASSLPADWPGARSTALPRTGMPARNVRLGEYACTALAPYLPTAPPALRALLWARTPGVG